MSIANYLKNEHRECDTLFAEAEGAVATNSWEEASAAFLAFSDQTLLHFKKEETELFPAFEGHTGMTQGPTQVMRFEHDQVREILKTMAEAIQNKEKDTYLSLAESMMILLQQHNMKEEQMLYNMCDMQLPHDLKEATLESMKKTVL